MANFISSDKAVELVAVYSTLKSFAFYNG